MHLRVSRIDEETVAILGGDDLLAHLITQIPDAADPDDSDAAVRRIYPSPTLGKDLEFDEDWKEYVQPDLKELFDSHLTVIRGDLATLTPQTVSSEFELKIPLRHMNAWIHGLNQARLALVERHRITEREMEEFPDKGDARSLALFQIYLYGRLQEFFIAQVME